MDHDEVMLPLQLPGFLRVPRAPAGLVIFAHSSGSSRLSPRNAGLAAIIEQAGLATLLFDLLSDDEAADRRNIFDVTSLAERLEAVVDWTATGAGLAGLPLAYFGAGTGAAAALVSAARRGNVSAVVTRGGRPDLAGPALSEVRAPTMLIVGSADSAVRDLNREAFARLTCEKALRIVPGATHLFEEAGTLERVAEHACSWLLEHLPRS